MGITKRQIQMNKPIASYLEVFLYAKLNTKKPGNLMKTTLEIPIKI